ncbi:MAG: DUF1801 domain-containing protein [Chitinophagaceae bacterium]|nr:DUF1801 domain-containing protein [Chitinophagaceae bacterium]
MAKKQTNLTLGISEPEKVDEFMKNLKHPMKNSVAFIRSVILSADKRIGEGIYWNAPTFYFTGEMKPFDPKEYKRYIAGFVFNKQDCIRMVFLQGASVTDKSQILEGDFKDGRKLVVFDSFEDVKRKEADLKKVVKELIKQMS